MYDEEQDNPVETARGGLTTDGKGRVAPSFDVHGSDTILVLRWSKVTARWEDWCRCSISQARSAVKNDRVPSMDKGDLFRLVDWISKRDVDPFMDAS